MSILQTHVIRDVKAAPMSVDMERIVKIGKDGEELVTYTPVDYKALAESHGTTDDWSLTNLLKSGINPDFPIRTGLATRIEGVGIINSMDSNLESIIAADVNTTPETTE